MNAFEAAICSALLSASVAGNCVFVGMRGAVVDGLAASLHRSRASMRVLNFWPGRKLAQSEAGSLSAGGAKVGYDGAEFTVCPLSYPVLNPLSLAFVSDVGPTIV